MISFASARPNVLARRLIAGVAVAGVALTMGVSSASAATSVSSLSGLKKTSRSAPVAPAPASVTKGQQVVNIARQYIGVPYVWGGSTPSGFDCSGLTSYVYRQVGVNLPRTSGSQSGVGIRIPASQAQPGELMWKPGHVGIYSGNGKMIHAPHTGTTVKEVAVYSSSFVYIRVL